MKYKAFCYRPVSSQLYKNNKKYFIVIINCIIIREKNVHMLGMKLQLQNINIKNNHIA